MCADIDEGGHQSTTPSVAIYAERLTTAPGKRQQSGSGEIPCRLGQPREFEGRQPCHLLPAIGRSRSGSEEAAPPSSATDCTTPPRPGLPRRSGDSPRVQPVLRAARRHAAGPNWSWTRYCSALFQEEIKDPGLGLEGKENDLWRIPRSHGNLDIGRFLGGRFQIGRTIRPAPAALSTADCAQAMLFARVLLAV